MEIGHSSDQSVMTLTFSSSMRFYEVENLCPLCVFSTLRSGENVGKCILCLCFPPPRSVIVYGVSVLCPRCVCFFSRDGKCVESCVSCGDVSDRMCTCPTSEQRMTAVPGLHCRPVLQIASSYSKRPFGFPRGLWNGRSRLWSASRVWQSD